MKAVLKANVQPFSLISGDAKNFNWLKCLTHT